MLKAHLLPIAYQTNIMDEGIVTGIITALVLGGVVLYIYIASRDHKYKKKK